MIALNRLPRSAPHEFALQPEGDTRAALATELGIEAIRKLRFTGRLTPLGATDWALEAELGATVVQPCVVSLQPVTTRIDTSVARRYLAQSPEPEIDTSGEAEMPEDDTVEGLPEQLDLSVVMAEALALALPDYPRADGVELGEAVFAAPGTEPMRDEDAKPLAGLKALRDKLAGDDDSAG